MGKYSETPVDRAAGGVVCSVTDNGPVVAVVHRPRYDDWSLPKGHVDAGETWEQAAIREVREETGVDAVVVGEPIVIGYMIDAATPKVVVFFPMEIFGTAVRGIPDPDEVDRVEWWSVARATEELTYSDERRVAEELARP